MRELVRGVSRAAAILLVSAGHAAGQSDFQFSPYAGALWLDGSCIYWSAGTCEGGFSHNDPGLLIGVRASLKLRDPWGIEIGYGVSPVSGDLPVVPIGDREPLPAPLPVREAQPFDARAQLYYGAVTYSLYRADRADLYLAGSVGGITFDTGELSAVGDPGAFTDLLLGLGFGGSIRLDRLILLRGDVRAYSQPCRDGARREGFVCDDGSLLGHAEISGGVVLTFPGLPPGS